MNIDPRLLDAARADGRITEGRAASLPEPMSEEQLLQRVLLFAKAHGWLSFHPRPARTTLGWRTAGSGDVRGFPDLVLVREIICFVELKSEKGKRTPEQEAWAKALDKAGHPIHLWRPSMLPEIEAFLA